MNKNAPPVQSFDVTIVMTEDLIRQHMFQLLYIDRSDLRYKSMTKTDRKLYDEALEPTRGFLPWHPATFWKDVPRRADQNLHAKQMLDGLRHTFMTKFANTAMIHAWISLVYMSYIGQRDRQPKLFADRELDLFQFLVGEGNSPGMKAAERGIGKFIRLHMRNFHSEFALYAKTQREEILGKIRKTATEKRSRISRIQAAKELLMSAGYEVTEKLAPRERDALDVD